MVKKNNTRVQHARDGRAEIVIVNEDQVDPQKALFKISAFLGGTILFWYLYFTSDLTNTGLTISDMFRVAFWENFGWMALLCFAADVGGMVLGLLFVKWRYKKNMRPVSDFVKSKPKDLFRQVVEVSLRAYVFMVGALQILQAEIFSGDTWEALAGAYLVIKLVVYGLSHLIAGAIF